MPESPKENLTDTPPSADAPVLESSTAWTKFEEEADIGDLSIMYQSWSSWSLHPANKWIAPFVTIALGDENGNLIFKRTMLITAIADLIEQLADTLRVEITKARDLPGFVIDLPGRPALMLADLEIARKHISDVLDIVSKSDMLRESPKPTSGGETPSTTP